MPMEMDHGLAQTQEVEALQAIYGADFTERPDARIWNCPAFSIKVRPVSLIDEGVNAWVTLSVKVRCMLALRRLFNLTTSHLSYHACTFLLSLP